ncbi:epoxyqueuosine reductase [Anaerocolumna jejuensis DSM 15929]|uniref:Epoxyqueuosine reductase n=1 Tax=Anaerocolumna jejuensis DSM 15929 TaxID=1121322 RepID=A0A1M6PWN7_9FIRM|nr:epoxyqueuosine reductase [Anaerocolumna jejuensis]SHK12312.1 epoxyqueuosine reductase [Anaerocolumna jejuensis DSM 15929]
MEQIEKLIQRKALELGYEKCGIIPVHLLEGYKEKLNERVQKVAESEAFYKGKQHLAHFEKEFPWAKSVVVLTVPQTQYKVPEAVGGHIAKSYLFDSRVDEQTKEHQHSLSLEAYMKELGLRVSTERKYGIVGLRWAAMQAGLGIIRRNNFFYSESGSWVRLEAFLTDRDMELIEKPRFTPCPKNCDRCIKACPTSSLCDAYTMNPLRCVSFLTTFSGRDLPQEPLAADFGEWIYGCDICQEVCPMNHGKWTGSEEFPGLTELAPSLTVETIMKMDEEFYRQKVQPKFFYLTPDELWKWQVNALNYMNNNYQEHFEQIILEACGSSFEKVREMAVAICKSHEIHVEKELASYE